MRHPVRHGPSVQQADRRGEGAGDLHGRLPAHDRRRYLHLQRCRACHRLPVGPFSRRFLRLQQGPYRQGPVHRYHEPNRGAWLEYETDSSDVYYVRIDKNRKLPVTTLLRALGLSTDEQIKQFFGDSEPKINASLEKDITHNTEEGLLEVYRKLRPGEPPTVETPART